MIQTIFNLLRDIHDADKPVDFRLLTAFAKAARESHSQDLRAVGTYFLRYDFMLQDYDIFQKQTLAKLFKTFTRVVLLPRMPLCSRFAPLAFCA